MMIPRTCTWFRYGLFQRGIILRVGGYCLFSQMVVGETVQKMVA